MQRSVVLYLSSKLTAQLVRGLQWLHEEEDRGRGGQTIIHIEGGIGTGKEIDRNNRKRARKADAQIGTIGGGKLGLIASYLENEQCKKTPLPLKKYVMYLLLFYIASCYRCTVKWTVLYVSKSMHVAVHVTSRTLM